MEATDRENLMRVLPYLLEIERQCKLALAAAGHMNTCTEAFWPLADPPSAIGDFDYAQRFVSSAAAISRILYAPKDRARHLCDLLGLGGDSPLASRKVRDAFEHIDERIDNWLKKNPGSRSYSSYGISRTGTEVPGTAALRHYDTQSDVLRVWDAEVKLQPVIEAVRNVQARTDSYLASVHFKH